MPESAAPSPRSSHVFLIEDDPDLSELVIETLKNRGHRTTWAKDANTALSLLSPPSSDPSQPLPPPPDLILLDLSLGGSDGVELMRDLLMVGIPLPPVIILSGRSPLSLEVAAGFVEAADVIRKPFTLEDLVAKVEGVLRRGP